MTAIKVLLVLSFVLILAWCVRNRHRVGMRAGARLAVVAVCVLAISAVIRPGLTQWAAERVGVTRGTDLVLYFLIVVFATSSVAYYLRFRDLEFKIAEVARAIALRDADTPAEGHRR